MTTAARADALARKTSTPIELERRHGARNYDPLKVVLERGEDVWLFDTAGRRYLDMMSAYSAVSFGHANPTLVHALTEQAKLLAVTSRAFHTARLGSFLERLCRMTGMDRALPMNTGAEAVETAIKAARKWAYKVKGVAEAHRRVGRHHVEIAAAGGVEQPDVFAALENDLQRVVVARTVAALLLDRQARLLGQGKAAGGGGHGGLR